MSKNPRIVALEHLVAKYEKSLSDFMAINEELRTLPATATLGEALELNEKTMASTARLLEFARERLAKERQLAVSPSDLAATAALGAQLQTSAA